ncbi:AMP-dependent synthetase and ligase [Beutenbergia cavernae DSM 12333]|uniref:Acyl-CoA synthetase n=1 Tax=Beutenbergia cavernae (strain ATCC BAA-8 / DSM 12333 / CCUG 43141 / JCM 11478 / NBRC 16432 / NCIMB 13614 / HKI 0122) TaxID=471853 RepID=C5BXF6_BEUC1|nr:AMP-dependent synthetase/ligase [Beutenbergia cavernae]ACQ80839.1 AMP-dependent synthetase and ligase [Beutenbergia cavernae DSM 12333]
MRVTSTPALVADDPALSIPALFAQRAQAEPNRTVLERKDAAGAWQPVSAATFADEVRALAKGLVAAGVEPGDRVSIMAHTSYAWTLLDFAIWAAGAVGVPVYETSSAEQIAWICTDSGVSLAFVEDAELAERTREADVASIRAVHAIADGLESLVEAGRDVEDAQIEARTAALRADDLATVIYTSGTTGRPKGVELTHGNFLHLVRNGVASLGEVCNQPCSRTLLFMPLAHVFARFIEVLCVTSAGVLGHSPGTRTLTQDLASFSPTFLLAVPRVFEKVYNSAEQKAGTGVRLRLFRWSAKVAITYSRAGDSARPSPVLRAQHALAGRLVHGKLRAAMGGALEYAVSGGAPLGQRLGHFFRGIGVTVLEGYGLTESTAPTAVNRPERIKIGTVGPAFPGTEIAIADDGEILVRGGHVFRGYRGAPDATAEAFTPDGWFHTGDLGTLDADGYLSITGRRKEIIITAGGKNVAPAALEDRLRGHPLVSQVVVVGDQRPFIGALVTIDADMLPGWLTTKGLPAMSVEEAAVHPDVVAALDRAAQRANRAVSQAESIRKFEVLTTDFTEANGYLTPSLKVKRALVLHDFADVIEDLYAGRGQGDGHDVTTSA